jgi:hypothetical protein
MTFNKTRSATRWLQAGATLATALTLAACGGSDGDSATAAGAGGAVGAAAPGTLRMAMTDAPSCGYDHVFVTVDRVRVHQSGTAAEGDTGWREIALAAPRRIDLLDLTNGVIEELGQTTLPAGRYTQLRLVLADNAGADPLANAVQPTGGALVPLRTPSAQQSGLKLRTSFDVQAGETTDLLLDFDACRSVTRAGNSGNFNLRPVVSVTPRVASGIQGYVSTTLTLNGTTVTAQQAGQVVRSTVPDANGRFVLGSLPSGNYDVVVASEGRSTAIVSSVPVTATTTVVNGTATAILPPVSAMREITGTVTGPEASTSAGTATTATTPTVSTGSGTTTTAGSGAASTTATAGTVTAATTAMTAGTGTGAAANGNVAASTMAASAGSGEAASPAASTGSTGTSTAVLGASGATGSTTPVGAAGGTAGQGSGTAAGTTGGTAGTATSAANLPVTDAIVRALQVLTGGPVVEVTGAPVDAVSATYRLRVPVSPPVLAPYAATGGLTFTANGTGGTYRVQAVAPDRTAAEAEADVTTADALADLVFAAP